MKWFPLFRRIREITTVNDDGCFPLLQPATALLPALQLPTLSLSPELQNDARRQHMVHCTLVTHPQVRNLFRWYIKHTPAPAATVLLAHSQVEALLAEHGRGVTERSRVAGTDRGVTLALQTAKLSMQRPAQRNDLRFFLNYIDLNRRCGRHEEALRVTKGTLGLFERLGTAAQRWKPCLVWRLVELEEDAASVPVKVEVNERVETIRTVSEQSVHELVRTMCAWLNEERQDPQQLERKLQYLLKLEADQLKATEFEEANGSCEYEQ